MYIFVLLTCVSSFHSLHSHVYGLFTACFLFQILIHMISLGFYLLLINMHRSKVKSLFEILDLQEISCIKTLFYFPYKIDLNVFIKSLLCFCLTKAYLNVFIKSLFCFCLTKIDLYFFYKKIHSYIS